METFQGSRYFPGGYALVYGAILEDGGNIYEVTGSSKIFSVPVGTYRGRGKWL